MRMIVEHHGIKITIEGDSEHYFGQDLYTRAVGALIWRVDTDGWEKHNREHGLDENTLESFCAAVLSALALMHAGKTKGSADESDGADAGEMSMLSSYTIRDLVLEMLDQFRDNWLLNTTISEADLHQSDDDG